jgi:hypothetical protein
MDAINVFVRPKLLASLLPLPSPQSSRLACHSNPQPRTSPTLSLTSAFSTTLHYLHTESAVTCVESVCSTLFSLLPTPQIVRKSRWISSLHTLPANKGRGWGSFKKVVLPFLPPSGIVLSPLASYRLAAFWNKCNGIISFQKTGVGGGGVHT